MTDFNIVPVGNLPEATTQQLENGTIIVIVGTRAFRARSNLVVGAPGKSAYEIWLDAGNTGTEDDFLFSLINGGDLAFRYGVNNVYTLACLPVDKQSVIATLNTDSTLSLSSDMKIGQVMMVEVNATANILITVPVLSGNIFITENTMELTAGQVGNINIWCVGNGRYSYILVSQ